MFRCCLIFRLLGEQRAELGRDVMTVTQEQWLLGSLEWSL